MVDILNPSSTSYDVDEISSMRGDIERAFEEIRSLYSKIESMSSNEMAKASRRYSMMVDPLEYDDGYSSTIREPVVLADADTSLVVSDNVGRVNVIPDVGGNRIYKLPTPVSGYHINFTYGGAAADASNPVIQTLTSDNSVFFKGSVTHLDTTADENVEPVFSNGSSNSKLTINVPSGIDLNFVAQSATVWYVFGTVTSATAPAFANQ